MDTEQKKDLWIEHIKVKNAFSKNPEDSEAFKEYFHFCLTQALENCTESDSWFSEAETILDIHAEKVTLSAKTLQSIKAAKNKFDRAIVMAMKKNDKIKNDAFKQVNNNNIFELHNLKELAGKIKVVSSKETFDSYLIELERIENTLEKDFFSDEQKIKYDQLTKDYATIVSDAMGRISHNEDISYNKKALNAYKKAYDTFKEDEKKFKHVDDNFKAKFGNLLFGWDSKRLFTETLIYYNQVYSYFFSKLGEDEKYNLSALSLDWEAKH